jgi:hypothetical protein
MVDDKVSRSAVLLGALLMGLLRVVDLAHADDRPVFDSPSAVHEYVGRQMLAHFQSELLKEPGRPGTVQRHPKRLRAPGPRRSRRGRGRPPAQHGP